MPNIGPWEIAIVLVIVLVIFGPKRLPEMGRSLGRGIREFKNSLTHRHDSEEEKVALTRAEMGTEDAKDAPKEKEAAQSGTSKPDS